MSSSSTARRSSSAPISSRSGRTRNTITAPTGCRPARCGCSPPRCCNSSATARPASSRPISRSSSTSRRIRSGARLYPAYKSHRPEPPDDLVPQFPLMRATVRAFGLIPIEQDRYEADDLIATYARAGARARRRRADRLGRQGPDAARSSPGVAMYDPASGEPAPGLARGAPHRRAEVFDYFGVRAGQGGRRPGARRRFDRQRARRARHRRQDRRAAHQRIMAISRRCSRARGEIKQPKRREALTTPEIVERIRMSKKLVTLGARRPARDAARRPRLARARRQGARRLPEGDGVHHDHPPRRRDLRRRRRRDRAGPALRRPGGWRGRNGEAASAAEQAARRAGSSAAAAAEAAAAAARRRPISHGAGDAKPRAPIDRAAYMTVRTLDELGAWIARAHEAGVVAFDTETSSLDPLQAELVGFSLAVAPDEACYIPLGHRCRRGRPVRRRRSAPDQMPGGGRDRAPEAAARGAGRAQDRPERQIRLAGLRPARHRRSRRSTTRC